jgi:hypothetical protein
MLATILRRINLDTPFLATRLIAWKVSSASLAAGLLISTEKEALLPYRVRVGSGYTHTYSNATPLLSFSLLLST